MSLASTLQQVRRDLRVLRLRAAGERLSPLVRREGEAEGQVPRATGSALGFRELRVAEVVQETPQAVTLHFEDSGEVMDHAAGQFLTVEVHVDGTAHRRAYSISSPEGDAACITVKRVDGGIVSTYLTTQTKRGDVLRVLGPSGSFGFDDAPAHALIIAGGSGITPCISIAETLLRGSSKVTMLYANNSWQDVIFRERLDDLTARYGERFTLEYFCEEPHPGATAGRLSADAFGRSAERLRLSTESAVFLCGPEAMMAALRPCLRSRGFADVREEHFFSARSAKRLKALEEHTVTLLAQGRQVRTQGTGTILELGLAAGVEMPFSCAVGGCAACKVRLVDGEVEHDELSCLTDGEKEEGYVLACSARAASHCTIEVPQ